MLRASLTLLSPALSSTMCRTFFLPALAVARSRNHSWRTWQRLRSKRKVPSSSTAHLRNPSKLEKAEKLDGSYLLKTDRKDLSADEVWRIYTLLTRAEAAFRTLKSPLQERPIHHRKEKRVEAHIFLCVLAYHLLISIEKTLLDRGVHTSWATVREKLRTHQVATIVLPSDAGMELRIRKSSTPEAAHREIYRHLAIPEEIVPPLKTWEPDRTSP